MGAFKRGGERGSLTLLPLWSTVQKGFARTARTELNAWAATAKTAAGERLTRDAAYLLPCGLPGIGRRWGSGRAGSLHAPCAPGMGVAYKLGVA
jgi:hypothetical protein